MNLSILTVVQAAQRLERRRSGLAQIIDEEVDVKLGGVGGSETDPARKVPLDTGSQGNDTDLTNEYGLWELYQVQV